MAQTGTVKAWRRTFGVVVTADEKVVRIYNDAIDGGSLRVGRKVSFDFEGEEGKLRGINVSGEAVLPKDKTLTEEEIAADKALIDEIRAEENKEVDAVMEVIKKLSRTNRLNVAKALQKMYPPKGPQKRLDGKQAFTEGEFIAFYGAKEGKSRWQSAPIAKDGEGKKKSRRNKKRSEGEEKEEEEKKEEKKEEEVKQE